MRTVLAALLLIAGAALSPGAGEAQTPPASVPGLAAPAPAPFTPEQRDAIVGILRTALRTDPTILRDAIAALQSDDRTRQDAASRTAIGRADTALARTPGDPVAGNPAGDVTVVEFYDLHCPYCRRMLPVVADLLARDPGVRLVYKDIPILGPGSVLGARAVLAAQKQGGYRRLHDAIMTGPSQITEDSLRAEAGPAGLDWPRLRADMADPAIAHRLDDNLALAHSLGIDGTPAYVVGGRLLPGAVSLGDLQDAVAAARAGRG